MTNIIDPRLSPTGLTQADFDLAKDKLHELEEAARKHRSRTSRTSIPVHSEDEALELEAVLAASGVSYEREDVLMSDRVIPVVAGASHQPRYKVGYKISTDDYMRLKKQEVI